jgi:hypothetical protein
MIAASSRAEFSLKRLSFFTEPALFESISNQICLAPDRLTLSKNNARHRPFSALLSLYKEGFFTAQIDSSTRKATADLKT